MDMGFGEDCTVNRVPTDGDAVCLLEAMKTRHSVRAYTDKALPQAVVEKLNDRITKLNNQHGLHIQLVTQEPKAFSGIMSYGQFSGVRNYFAMIGKQSQLLDEHIGYCGEQLVLLAQTLGLNTCWVGVSYRAVEGAYHIAKGEKLACVIAVGYGASQGKNHKRKTTEQVSNVGPFTPDWFRKGVEAALLAPTAINQQRFRFEYVGTTPSGTHRVEAHRGFSPVGYTLMDLGIAKLHFELGAGKEHFEWASQTPD
ncbi:MAG: nitroreductase family protein [Bacteroidales bacterium]|nr:nitroreductase family protein [Bacteroidales bacterium]